MILWGLIGWKHPPPSHPIVIYFLTALLLFCLDFVNKKCRVGLPSPSPILLHSNLHWRFITVLWNFILPWTFFFVYDHLYASIFFSLFKPDVGADVLDLAETMVASADGLIYEPVSVFCHAGLACCLVPLFFFFFTTAGLHKASLSIVWSWSEVCSAHCRNHLGK